MKLKVDETQMMLNDLRNLREACGLAYSELLITAQLIREGIINKRDADKLDKLANKLGKLSILK